MFGKLKTNEARAKVEDPNKVTILAIFQERTFKRYIIEANHNQAQHPRRYMNKDNYEVLYYDKKLDGMRGGFYWLLGHDIELIDISSNKAAAKSLLMEEY